MIYTECYCWIVRIISCRVLVPGLGSCLWNGMKETTFEFCLLNERPCFPSRLTITVTGQCCIVYGLQGLVKFETSKSFVHGHATALKWNEICFTEIWINEVLKIQSRYRTSPMQVEEVTSGILEMANLKCKNDNTIKFLEHSALPSSLL